MKTALITGGTGTLGKELIKQILAGRLYDRVICFSRGEERQQKQKAQLADDRVRFVIGDVRDAAAVFSAVRGADTVFHLAALKHIDLIEENVAEAIKTNISGTMNIVAACKSRGINDLVFCSTDKAVDPINAYGFTKALGEKLVLSASPYYKVFRWGNIVGSNGSVIPKFIDQIMSGGGIRITDMAMTRFWISVDDAAMYMLVTSMSPVGGGVFVPTMKAAALTRVVESLVRLCKKERALYNITGLRAGEKIHESIWSEHVQPKQNSFDYEQYTDEELDKLLKPSVEAYVWRK